VTAALAGLAIGEAAVIAALVYARPPAGPAAITIESVQPGSNVVVDGRQVGVTPLKVNVDSRTQSVRVLAPEAATGTTGVSPRQRRRDSAAADTRAAHTAAAGRPGGLRVTSPIDLQIMENGRLLGSSGAGSIVLAAGAHQLDLVNTALGYRSRESVAVKVGEVASLGVSLPNGRLSINAVPWAEVWIDGKLAGETPLGNLSIPIGEHEVLFRHPQLGERRQSATVRPDAVTRVSANLQQ
jgi:hypothetical protein